MRTAIVTGASSGIGAATAKLLAEAGYSVLLLGRNANRLQKIHEQIQGTSFPVVCDLTSSDDIHKFCQKFIAGEYSKSPLKLLVHNAGVFKPASFQKTEDSEWIRQFETSIMGPVRLTRNLLSVIKDQQTAIINISSTLGLKPVAETAAYSALKAAMVNWSQSLAIELAPFKVRVNCICPGIVDTPIHNSKTPLERKQWLEKLEQIIPLHRPGLSQEVAEVVLFLGGEKSQWTTGNTFFFFF